MQPVIKIEKLFFRTNPIFHAILPAGYEHYAFMGLPREPFIYKNVSNVASVRGVRLTEGGCCWLHGVMSIEKTREGDAKNAILAAFAAHPSMKKVVVVDSDVDIFDDRAVEWALATRFQASTDMVIIENVTGSSLDPSAHTDDLTTKIGLDATKPLKRRAVFEKATL
jgi:UbiD family decarboxylase